MEKKDLRIVFMGTPEFAVPSLKGLIDEGYNIVGVVTAPDRPSGRGKKIKTSAIKHFAVREGLRLFQPVNLKDEQFIDDLRAAKANLQVVVAFRMLPEKIWHMPSLGTFNLHASLLPQYRGAAPINHAIINGEKTTGLTTFLLDEQIDTGKIILQKKVQIGDDEDVGGLHDKLMILGADLVKDTVEIVSSGKVKFVPQSNLISPSEALLPAPKIFKADCRINWTGSVEEIYNFIRGLSPYPGAFTFFITPNNDLPILLKIFKTSKEYSSHSLKIGQLIVEDSQSLKVAVKDGFIHLLEIQLAGKKRMDADDFLRGFSIIDNYQVQ